MTRYVTRTELAIPDVKRFLEEGCDHGAGLTCVPMEVWDGFNRWAAQKGLGLQSKGTIARALTALGCERTIGPHAYIGFKPKPELWFDDDA